MNGAPILETDRGRTRPAPAETRSLPLASRLRRRILGISENEASFERRRFPPCGAAARARLESIGRTFIRGYCTALEEVRPDPLALRLDEVDLELRGFAFEGAAMGLAILDRITPWRRDRLASFLAGPGDAHAYMVHVGAGWAMARLGQRADDRGPEGSRTDRGSDPLLRWLMLDGYGFHEGYFHWETRIRAGVIPRALSGYACRVFDQGLGRCLWFVTGADVGKAVAAIDAFVPGRRSDLWGGVGLAAAYAGGLDRAGLEALRKASGEYHPQVAQGVAFAAKARQRAGNGAPHTDLASAVLCGMPADDAARITDEALLDLPAEGREPAYETWRKRVQSRFAPPGAVVSEA